MKLFKRITFIIEILIQSKYCSKIKDIRAVFIPPLGISAENYREGYLLN